VPTAEDLSPPPRDEVALATALNGVAWQLIQQGDLSAAARAVDEALSLLSTDGKIAWDDALHTVAERVLVRVGGGPPGAHGR
jgi:hypothetical protein